MDSPLQSRLPKAEDSMPFFGTAFFEATEGYSDAVCNAYLRALWHYWNHTHCQGLPDDDEYLRRVCRTEPQEWARVKGIVFDNRYFFCMNGTHWHQKAAKDLHSREVDLYNRRVAWAENARKHRGLSNSKVNNNDNNITPIREITLRGEYDRLLVELDGLRARYHPTQQWLTKDTERRSKLIGRREELRKLLGITV